MYAWSGLGQGQQRRTATEVIPRTFNPHQQHQHLEQLAFQAMRPMFMPQAPPPLMSAEYMRYPSQPSQRSSQDEYPSDESSDPNGHDLGFLSLLYPSPESSNGRSCEDGSSSNGSGGGQRESSANGQVKCQARVGRAHESCHGPYTSGGARDHGNDEDIPARESTEGSKRRRGRPVGSKDRQPRVKRMATSPMQAGASARFEKTPSACDGEGGRRKPWKIILTAEQAVEIYKQRVIGTSGVGASAKATSSCRSNEVAEQYGVNSKTIRDIWNRATWVKATRPSWTQEEEAEYASTQASNSGSGSNGAAHEAEGSHSARSCCDEDKASVASQHAQLSALQEKRRGRPKGARDLRPRGSKHKPGRDAWQLELGSSAEGTEAARAAAVPTLGKVQIMTAQARDLQCLIAPPGAPPPPHPDDRLSARQQQTSRNSSSNTSHSQTSSYTNDDSHSGDQGSDSGGSASGTGNSPHQHQAPRSPGVAYASARQVPATVMGLGGVMDGVPRDKPSATLSAFNRYAHVQGLSLPTHRGGLSAAGAAQLHAVSHAHMQQAHMAQMAGPHMHAPALQDLSLYPGHCGTGHETATWGKPLALPQHALTSVGHQDLLHAHPSPANPLEQFLQSSRALGGRGDGGGHAAVQSIDLAGNDGLHHLGVFPRWQPQGGDKSPM